jgi:hypothetical protein
VDKSRARLAGHPQRLLARGCSFSGNSSLSFESTTRAIVTSHEIQNLSFERERHQMLRVSSSAVQLMLGDPSLRLSPFLLPNFTTPHQTNKHPTMHATLPHKKTLSSIQGAWPMSAEPCSMQALRNSALTRGPHASKNNDDVETKSAFSTETRTQPRPRLHAYTTCM